MANPPAAVRVAARAIVVGLFCFSVPGCGEAYQVPPDVLRLQVGAEPASLNPVLENDAYAAEVGSYLFDTLIERNPDTFEFRPKIASSWEVSEDKKTYTFHLRPDVKWHDNEPVTAEDVAFSFALVLDPRVPAPHLKGYYDQIESVTALDRLTVRFVYKKLYFKALEDCGGILIVPKHRLEHQIDQFAQIPFSRAPLGNGPYVFKEWRTNKKITLTRNENYWGPKPEIRTIEFKIVHDDKIALQLLKKGDLDRFGLSTLQWSKLTSSAAFARKFTKLTYPRAGYGYIGWNLKFPLFADAKVRRAMTHMLDRVKINEKLYFGLAQPLTGPFMPYSKQYNHDVALILYDPAAARRLLAEAGWQDSNDDGWLDKDGKSFAFEFLAPSGAGAERLPVIFKEDLARIGIKMDIVTMEWAAFLERINEKKFQATTLGWQTSFETDPHQVWHSSQAKDTGGSNFVSFANPEADRLIDEARVEFNEDKRNALYHQLHTIIAQEQPYTFLFNVPSLTVVSQRFDNVLVHKLGMDMLEWRVKK